MTSEPAERIVAVDDPLARQVTDVIRTGDVQALERLLHEQPDLARIRIGDTECSRTLLHVATDWPGHYPHVSRTIQILVAARADPDARFIGRSHQETPLHWAASSGDVEAVDALLDAGANIDSPGGVMASGTPLEDARIFGQWKPARRLVERGATPQLDDEAALGLVDRLRARLADAEPEVTADELDRAFWYACHGGQLRAAILLAERGANIDWTPPWELLTPLDAARRSQEKNDVDARSLIQWLEGHSASSAAPGDPST
jgi:uncharacterized protein